MVKKVSIVSPSIREGGLDILSKCLERQTFKNFEWLVSTNYVPPKNVDIQVGHNDKGKDDFYTLNKDWNILFRRATGELLINIVDQTWIDNRTLEKLWNHYKLNPKACISCVGHQYQEVINGKPETIVWQDPRLRKDLGSFYEVNPSEMELCVASFPKQAVLDVGGIEEEMDKVAALSEKEMMLRIQKAGYGLYLCQDIEYRSVYHERLSQDWDKRYKAGVEVYNQYVQSIIKGDRLKLNYL